MAEVKKVGKEKKTSLKLICILLFSLFIITVVIFFVVAFSGAPKSKEYISQEEFTEKLASDKAKAIEDGVVAYGRLYVTQHYGKCPTKLEDFLENTDVLDELQLIVKSIVECSIIYRSYTGDLVEASLTDS